MDGVLIIYLIFSVLNVKIRAFFSQRNKNPEKDLIFITANQRLAGEEDESAALPERQDLVFQKVLFINIPFSVKN
jgi:hypothetical protein